MVAFKPFFNIVSAPRTCHELKEMGVEISAKYFIDPDGPWMGAKPIEVFCNMKTGQNS
jgi:hypothetical protein